MPDYQIDHDSPIPLYYQIYLVLIDMIKVGQFEPDSPLPAERQLAENFKVSRLTVVKALEMLEIKRMIRREHGRGTFVNAQTNDRSENRTIAFMSSMRGHPYHYSILMGIADVASRHGFQLLISTSDHDQPNQDVLRHNLDGVLVYPRPDEFDLSILQKLRRNGVPIVCVDHFYDDFDTSSVTFDDQEAGYQLTKLLLDRGHERIGLVAQSELTISSISGRLAGYRKAMREHEVFDADYIWPDVYDTLRLSTGHTGTVQMTQLLAGKIKKYRPTAIVALTHDATERLNYDIMQINSERAKHALKTGGSDDFELDIEIAGFGYSNLAEYGSRNLYTALQPGDILGRAAAYMIINHIDDSIVETAQRVIPIKIVDRDNNVMNTKILKNSKGVNK